MFKGTKKKNQAEQQIFLTAGAFEESGGIEKVLQLQPGIEVETNGKFDKNKNSPFSSDDMLS